MIIVVGSNKGGASKSTLCINIAVALALRGGDVCYLDADVQHSGAIWHSFREEAQITPSITYIQASGNLAQTLQNLSDKFTHIVVDVPGRNSREFITAGAVADLIIAPHLCSQLDLSTVDELEQQQERWLDLNPNLKVRVYHTRATTNPITRPRERADFLAFMANYPTLQVLESIQSERTPFRTSISEGKGVLEMTGKPAAAARAEIEELMKEVF